MSDVVLCLRCMPSTLMSGWMSLICVARWLRLYVCGTLFIHSHGLWSLSLCGKWMYICWPKYCGLYLSCRRKALTSSCFSGVNVFPGNASFSCCFVTLKSVCGLRLSRIIGVIILSFVLCLWDVDLVCWLVCGVFGVAE